MSSTQTTTTATMPGPDHAVTEAIERGNKVVFFDVVLGADSKSSTGDLGRIKLELFVKEARFNLAYTRLYIYGQIMCS